jgi:tRNA pseudouridine13 synthase
VAEVEAYAPAGEGDHWYVRAEKRGLTTPELVAIVARAAGVAGRDVGHAGLKDKHAITEQWLSLPAAAEPPESWQLPDSVRVLRCTRHKNKLRTGHLKGNQFEIVLDGVADDAAARAQPILDRLKREGLANYFGEQRFGRAGHNVVHAIQWLKQGKKKRGPKARFHAKLYPSVLQAEVFNRYLTLRQARGMDTLIAGEVVRLQGSGSSFVVEQPAVEQPRLASGDIVLTGPIFGPKAPAGKAEAGELEAAALGALELEEPEFDQLGRLARGTRRDLVVSLGDATVTSVGPGQLKLSFFLPAGSYATQLVREFTRAPWCEARSGPPPQ